MEIVSICANCQKEFPEVDEVIKTAEKEREDIKFSHGVCKRHYIYFLKQMQMDDAQIEIKLQGKTFKCPDLKASPELIKQYSSGVFTPEDYKKAQFPINSIKELFQRRAGIA